ncbi:uncharacterized protein PV06_06895 [Exophiala oligosperma]|uniref:Uncharacterized protein n=2 Tax=Chaetothyriales TaxID=34395 RepID=A0A0D2AMY0_9EURO|nr:uncharacterized protein PV06_06895 [Exophiala oligosperma]KAJ9617839.1 hypothetical protein H2204_013366 [Knufia peltigerae]KIW41326.1 hypothetical protein PV06_06895 [Exophiala oligosperma]
MKPAAPNKESFVLPKLKYKYKSPVENDRFIFYDVKFYPYSTATEEEPIFAVLQQKGVIIYRISSDPSQFLTTLQNVVDQQELEDKSSPGLNSCSWCYIDPQKPLLAVAGGTGQLKIMDVLEGDLFTTLVGHGYGVINDIATHPLYPWIVVTASMDKSLRIWDLRRYASPHESPTIIICGQATGHCEGVLTVSWHASGRYLVSGGHDQRICVWAMPDLSDGSSFWQEVSPEYRKRSSNEVYCIHYPHFTSSAVHSNFVDCARFYGDLIISKAANENKIVLWKMTAFDSSQPPPSSVTAPKIEDYLDTRNGFMRKVIRRENGLVDVEVAEEYEDEPPYERLLEFETPWVEQFYLRFGLLLPSVAHPEVHPVLAFANAASELRFWDLERFSLGHAGGLDVAKAPKPKKKHKGVAQLIRPQDRLSRAAAASQNSNKDSSPASMSSNPSSMAGPGQTSTDATSEFSEATASLFTPRDHERYPIHDAHITMKPHARVSLTELQFKNQAHFNARAADWSPCGKWCVVVGESAKVTAQGMEGYGGFAVLHR